MKILNLYAGIGGNRKLWDEHLQSKFGNNYGITAVEYDENIAKIYQDYFPNDKMIVTDAHQYLLEHFKEYDFIWSSPPCQSHSRLNTMLNYNGINRYPDMSLYQQIIFLKHWFYGKYVIENVKPYYEPIVKPDIIIGRHYFWSNIKTPKIKSKYLPIKGIKSQDANFYNIKSGYNVNNYYNYKGDKRTLFKNLVDPKIGKAFLEKALNIITEESVPQGKLF